MILTGDHASPSGNGHGVRIPYTTSSEQMYHWSVEWQDGSMLPLLSTRLEISVRFDSDGPQDISRWLNSPDEDEQVGLTPVEASKSFQKAFCKKPPEMQEAIDRAVVQLRKDWRHPGLRTGRIGNTKGVYEARVDGGNRLTFHWEGEAIRPREHCNHKTLDHP